MDKLTISNMELYYGDFKALKGINLNIQANEITAFIGPSGCGKSTLLKSLNRMNDLVEGCRITGSILLDGEDIYGDMDINLLRKRVGMVFQKPNPFPMSVYDNIAYGPRTHGIRSKAQLDDIVEKSLRDAAIWDELKDRLKKSALGLSGGQQQRLCIARALAVQPGLLQCTDAAAVHRKVPGHSFLSGPLTHPRWLRPAGISLQYHRAALWSGYRGYAGHRQCCRTRSSGTGSASGIPYPLACAEG